MSNLLQAPATLTFNLGQTLAERKQAVKQIKDAMAAAILWQVELNGSAEKNNEDYQVYESLYLEAKNIERILEKV